MSYILPFAVTPLSKVCCESSPKTNGQNCAIGIVADALSRGIEDTHLNLPPNIHAAIVTSECSSQRCIELRPSAQYCGIWNNVSMKLMSRPCKVWPSWKRPHIGQIACDAPRYMALQSCWYLSPPRCRSCENQCDCTRGVNLRSWTTTVRLSINTGKKEHALL